nr:MAG TPA: hypothetical protein [Caudoviricetes sp.]
MVLMLFAINVNKYSLKMRISLQGLRIINHGLKRQCIIYIIKNYTY